MGMTDEKYNGWTNRETWLVNLWLSNEEASYFELRERVAERKASDMETDDRILGEIVEEYVEEMLFGDKSPAGLATDLLRGALSDVDWEEIGRAFAEE